MIRTLPAMELTLEEFERHPVRNIRGKDGKPAILLQCQTTHSTLRIPIKLIRGTSKTGSGVKLKKTGCDGCEFAQLCNRRPTGKCYTTQKRT